MYNAGRIARDNAGTAHWWWLRTPGYLPGYVTRIGTSGSIYMLGISVYWPGGIGGGVRPAMWIALY